MLITEVFLIINRVCATWVEEVVHRSRSYPWMWHEDTVLVSRLCHAFPQYATIPVYWLCVNSTMWFLLILCLCFQNRSHLLNCVSSKKQLSNLHIESKCHTTSITFLCIVYFSELLFMCGFNFLKAHGHSNLGIIEVICTCTPSFKKLRVSLITINLDVIFNVSFSCFFCHSCSSRQNGWASDLREAQCRETYSKVSPSLHSTIESNQITMMVAFMKFPLC